MSVCGKFPSSLKSKQVGHNNANGQRGKTPESRLWIFGGKRPFRKANARNGARAGTFHTADGRLLHPRDFLLCCQPIFCKRRLKNPVLVALNQEVALLDWNERYTIYAHPCGMDIVAVSHRDAAMLRRMARNSYTVMRPYQEHATYTKADRKRAKIL
jgi:hypothetical protein